MNDYVEPLDELTLEFLNSVNYPNVHMSWREWAKKAKAYGLTDEQIAELEQHLEENNQLTSPVVFAGRRWWLTRREMKHVELIKQYYPTDWETQVLRRMDCRDLGYPDKDRELNARNCAVLIQPVTDG
jgi:glutaredoxin